jgi:membrane fusion protein, multidrug efflux system
MALASRSSWNGEGAGKSCLPKLRRVSASACLAIAASLLLSGCERESEAAPPQIRPVRTVTVEKREAGQPVSLTGRIEAEDEVALAFRISGRLAENGATLGARVEAGQVIARLEPQNELNALRAAQAALSAAQGLLTEARNHFDRQDRLLRDGWTTRANHDQAARALRTAEAQVDAAEAQLKAAHDTVSFTELRADAPGVITEVGPAAGEVVQVGQPIARLARQDGRDAVFDVPANMISAAPADPAITVTLTSDPGVIAKGRVREVAPQANAATRTFEVKVGLTDPPEAMRLGATVTGRLDLEAVPFLEVPGSALTRTNGQPAVWVVDPDASTVSMRNVDVLRFDQSSVSVSGGLDIGEVVVTAGVQALHPGQKVRILGSEP